MNKSKSPPKKSQPVKSVKSPSKHVIKPSSPSPQKKGKKEEEKNDLQELIQIGNKIKQQTLAKPDPKIDQKKDSKNVILFQRNSKLQEEKTNKMNIEENQIKILPVNLNEAIKDKIQPGSDEGTE